MIKTQRKQKREQLIKQAKPTSRILVDWEIREYVKKHRMLEPFEERLKRDGAISYGLSSMGYDIRVTDDYKIFTNVRAAVVDPKQFSPDSFVDFKGPVCVIPPNSFALARSVEYFRIPRSVLGICLGKSSYARCGIVVNITPLEPCYDRATELLTDGGWKKFSDVSGEEKVATLNVGGELEYQKILKVHRFTYRGKLVAIRGRNIDLAVTPEHLLLVKKRWGKRFEFLPAKQVYGKYNYELKRDAVWNCKRLRAFTLPAIDDRPAIKIPIEHWLQFFGFWLAEGSCYQRARTGDYKIKIACFDEKNKRWIASVLKGLPFHVIPIDTGFLIQNKQLYAYLSQFGHAPEKFVPREITMLPPQQLTILLDALMRGDGNLQTLTYTTTSKRLADDVQEIIMKAGWAAIVRRLPMAEQNRRSRSLSGHLIRHNFDVYKIRVSKRQLTPKIYKHSFSTMDYDDVVYDVTVPNHTLYVRRNGKPCWSSNCWEGHLTIEISNTTPLPARVYSHEGIAQVLFFEAGSLPNVSYADRKGKYQGQTGITLPKV